MEWGGRRRKERSSVIEQWMVLYSKRNVSQGSFVVGTNYPNVSRHSLEIYKISRYEKYFLLCRDVKFFRIYNIKLYGKEKRVNQISLRLNFYSLLSEIIVKSLETEGTFLPTSSNASHRIQQKTRWINVNAQKLHQLTSFEFFFLFH